MNDVEQLDDDNLPAEELFEWAFPSPFTALGWRMERCFDGC